MAGDLEAADDDGVASGSWKFSCHPPTVKPLLDAITGEWTYTPDEHYNGPDAFTVAVTDDSDQGNVGTLDVEITVTPIDDPATFSGDLSVNGVALTTVTGTLVATDDADGMSNPNYTVTGPGYLRYRRYRQQHRCVDVRCNGCVQRHLYRDRHR